LKEQPKTKDIKSVKSGVIWGGVHSFGLILIKAFRALMIPKILISVAEYGLFSSINYFTRYLQLSDLGAKAFFVKKFPHYYFNDSEEKVQNFINQIFSFTLLSFIGIAIYLSLISLFYTGSDAGFYKYALLLLIPIMIILKLRELLLIYSNSIQEYKKSTNLKLLYDFSSLIFAVVGVYLGGALGGVWALLANEIVVFIITAYKIRVKFKFIFNKTLFKDIRGYLNLFFINLAELANVTIDQTFILIVFSVEEFGIYAIALMIHWLMIAISNVFKISLLPKIMALGKRNPKKIKSMLDTVIISFLACCMLATPFILLGVDIVTHYYLTKFIIGIPIYFLAAYSGIARALNGLLKDFYIVNDGEKDYVRRIIFYTIFAVGLYSIIYFLEYSIYKAMYFILLGDTIMLLVLLKGLGVAKLQNLAVVFAVLFITLAFQYLHSLVTFLSVEYILLHLANIILLTVGGGMILYRSRNAIKSAISSND
jgi:O-antigen/teichoic acid export membrane protein